MAHIRGEVAIGAPVEDVFDFVADERNEPKYNRRIIRAEKVGEGPVGQGSRFIAQPAGIGSGGAMTVEILEYERPRRFRNIIRSSYMQVDGTVTFTDEGNGTLLRWDWHMGLVGPMKLLSPVLALVAPRWERRNWWLSSGTWNPGGPERPPSKDAAEVTDLRRGADVMTVIGGVAAVLADAALLGGVASLVFVGAGRWCPWLAVLLGFNARYRVAARDELRGIKPIDVALLVMAGAAYAGFWPGPGSSQVVWMTLAIAQPLLGIPMLIATKLSGRSGLMGGALVLSILMLVDGRTSVIGWLGASASVLLLVGDFGTTARPSRLLAVALALGYAVLIVWFAGLASLLL